MNNNTWQVFHFGLLVTGRTEEKHLPKLFNALQSEGGVQGRCHFEVIRAVHFFVYMLEAYYFANANNSVLSTNFKDKDKP